MSDAFTEALDASRAGVKRIEQWLNDQGYVVVSFPTAVRPHVDEREEYRDFGDLYVGLRAEAKHLSAEFSCREDWPFAPHFIVCAKPAYDKAIIKPRVFYYLSKSMTCIAIVKSNSHPHWYVQSRTDMRPHRNASGEYYFCPLRFVTFNQL